MRLKKPQRETLLEWIAEGLTSDEINNRASLLDDPFDVSRQQVDHYRKTRKFQIDEILQQSEYDALNVGLAKKAARVDLLKRVAAHLTEDLFERKLFWTDMVKGIGSKEDFQVVEYEEFNAAEVTQLRGVLDDIAKEVGERETKTDITSGGKPLQKIDAAQLTDDELETIEKLFTLPTGKAANAAGSADGEGEA